MTEVSRGGGSAERAQVFYDDTDGAVTKVAYGNGAYATYGYDGSGALTKISHYVPGYPSDTLIASNAYEFDAAGNVTKMVLDDGFGSNQTGDGYVTYQYDDLYRLTREQCVASSSPPKEYIIEYAYDSAGNRVSKRYYDGSWHTASYSYSARNELTYMSDLYGVSWDVYYDARANLTRKWDQENESRYEEEYVYTDYYWDSRDLLTKVHIVDGSYEYIDKTVEYKYDLMGRRVAKRVDQGSWRWYFYDGLKVIAEGTATNDKIFYTNGPGAIGGIISRDNNGTKYWFHYDRLGNVVGVTDGNGAVVSLYTMEAFGNVLEMTNGGDFSNERSTDVQPYHLTSKEYDPDTGLYYFNARWYDRNTGRFISREPTRIDGPNLYLLCGNNPIALYDIDGLFERKLSDTILFGLMDFGCGFGDAMMFGTTKIVRRNLMGITVECSTGYQTGGIASFALGVGRLGYGGAAKGVSLILRRAPTLENARRANRIRNALKKVFRAGLFPNRGMLSWEKAVDIYQGNPLEIIKAAGRTNKDLNVAGALLVGGAIVNTVVRCNDEDN